MKLKKIKLIVTKNQKIQNEDCWSVLKNWKGQPLLPFLFEKKEIIYELKYLKL